MHITLLALTTGYAKQVTSAKGLRAADLNGLSDPYCVVRLGKTKYKTQVPPSSICSLSDLQQKSSSSGCRCKVP